MNRPKAQGTSWESEFVRRARDVGIMADRLPEHGLSDDGDVWLVNPPGDASNTSVALGWRRLVPVHGGNRRVPDGVRDGVFLRTDDFLALVAAASIVNHDVGWVVECKARQNLNVTRALDKARRKALG